MSDSQGLELEDRAHEVFTNLGLTCVHRLKQVRLQDLDPNGAYGQDDHLEFDFLIVIDDVCIVGEITARQDPRKVKEKYQRYNKAFNVLRNLDLFDQRVWSLLGVPQDKLPDFRNISSLRGGFITTKLEQFDVTLSPSLEVAALYGSDWKLLEGYSDALGIFGREHVSHHFNIPLKRPKQNLTLTRDDHQLNCIHHKKVASGDLALADVFTFEASPYEILPFSKVYRRDNLPSLTSGSEMDYQRPLSIKKLEAIRNNLLTHPDFIFPNSILCVLSNDCEFDKEKKMLTISTMYGSLSVIDGQHRLYSFADEGVRANLKDPKVLITAIMFDTDDEDLIAEYSAQTFVEINTNQTTINRNHLDVIAYEILGQTHERALAAQVILRVNSANSNESMYGLFDTYQTGLGIIKINEVISALKLITKTDVIEKLENAQRGNRALQKQGYENILASKIADLKDAETLIQQCAIALRKYFNLVRKAFPEDWPKRNSSIGSSLEYAKVIAALVKLLRKFIHEGADWPTVESELGKIRRNIQSLADITDDKMLILDASHPDIPDSSPSVSIIYNFFLENRNAPTSITKLMKAS